MNIEKLYKFSIIAVYTSLLTIIIITAIVQSGILAELDSAEAIVELLGNQQNSTKSVLTFILIEFLQVTFVPIPSSIVTAAGALMFSPRLLAILWCCCGLWLGSIVAFLIGRFFGVNVVKWIVGEDSLKKYYGIVKGKDQILLFFMFILPIFPDDLLCMIAGLTSMSFPVFCLMQLISRPLNVSATIYLVEIFKLIPFKGWGIAVWVAIAFAVIGLMLLFWKYSSKLEFNLIRFINSLSKRNILTYQRTEIEEYIKRDFLAEERVYNSDPYDDNSNLKRDVASLLESKPTKYYNKVSNLVENTDSVDLHFKF